MSLGVQDASTTQALVENLVLGAYQARWARLSALVMLLWDHGNYWCYTLYLIYHRCVVTCLDREVELVWVCPPSFHHTGVLN